MRYFNKYVGMVFRSGERGGEGGGGVGGRGTGGWALLGSGEASVLHPGEGHERERDRESDPLRPCLYPLPSLTPPPGLCYTQPSYT
jgi:hypothetical protein